MARQEELKRISRSEGKFLDYINPEGVIRWQSPVLQAYEEADIDPRDCLKVTVVHEPWHTNDKDWLLPIAEIKRDIHQAFRGFSYIGMIEFAVFTNVRHGNGVLIAIHFECVFLEKPSLRQLDKARKCFFGSSLGADPIVAKKVNNLEGAVRYTIKLPAHGYRHNPYFRYWLGEKKNPSTRLYLPMHYQLFKHLGDFSFPELTVAGGEGAAIRRRAIALAKRRGFVQRRKLSANGQQEPQKNHLQERMPAMEKKAKLSADRINFYHLSGDGGINSGVAYSRRNIKIRPWIAECKKDNYAASYISEMSNLMRYKSLQEVYKLSLNAWDKHDELVALAKSKKLRFNSRTDIFAFVLKVIYGDKGQARRRVSDHANALRYLHYLGVNADEVADKFAELGGIRKCCKVFAAHRHSQKKPKDGHSKGAINKQSASQKSNRLWSDIKSSPVARFKKFKGKLPKGRYAILGHVTKSGELLVYKAFSVKKEPGSQMLLSARVG